MYQPNTIFRISRTSSAKISRRAAGLRGWLYVHVHRLTSEILKQSKPKKKQIMWPFELRTNPYMYCKERSWSRPDRAAKSSLAIDKSCAHKKVLKFADIHAGPRPARRHFVAYTCVRGRRHARVFLILNKIRRLRGGLFHGDSCRR